MEKNLTLQEFCDMEQLFSLLDNWSKSTGMVTSLVSPDGQPVSEYIDNSDFCARIQACPEGMKLCSQNWISSEEGIHICPLGFSNFTVPIVLPNGQVLGKIIAGQALTEKQDEEEIIAKSAQVGIGESEARESISRVSRKTDKEMAASYDLLKEMIQFFVERNYSVWSRTRELLNSPDRNDIVLSQLTKLMYSFHLSINIATGEYSLIKGTGMDATVEEYKKHSNFYELKNFHKSIIHPSYFSKIETLLDFDSILRDEVEDGFRGAAEYPVLYPGEEKLQWHEINVFINTEYGIKFANILGRDVTAAHEAKEKREKELRAASDKNRILSELTKKLYSYNLTLNLRTGKFSLLLDTGSSNFMKILRSTDDYETAYNEKLKQIVPDSISQFAALASLPALRARRMSNGYIGNLEYGAIIDGKEEWHEINIFISTDEQGEAVANILGRDVTVSHQREIIRRNQQRAAIARDQLLSGITKMLYGYNLTVNLTTWKYSLIAGTGMEDVVRIMRDNDDYFVLASKLTKGASPAGVAKLKSLISVSVLKEKMNKPGFAGSVTYPYSDEKWFEANLFIGTDENGTPIANILGRDISDIHEKENTKAQLEIEKASNAAKTAFLFNMSHDIRTPMNAIIGFTELLDKNLENTELSRAYLGKLKQSNDFLLSIINNVLEMARIENNKLTLNEEMMNIHDFDSSLFALFDAEMGKKGIIFIKTVDVQHTDFLCDETKVREIFLNILSNALKYTPAGGKVYMRLKELPSERPGYIVYRSEIEDTGIGMSEDFLKILFDSFARERNTTDSGIGGTGLGMAIVKRLIDFMGGTIEVKSEVGKGTKFVVTLTHKLPTEAQLEKIASKKKAVDPEIFRGKRILLAEDNELNAEIAITMLEDAGFRVEHASDGAICVNMLKQAPEGYYDLILMDIQMPNMNGYKAASVIRRLPDPIRSGITIIAMTANAFEEDKKNAFEAGMNGHIAKPLHIESLLEQLSNYII